MTAENSPRIVGGFLFVIMKVHITTPYSIDKNLGQAYNAAMEIIPDGDAACFIDGDIAFTVPNYGHILSEYVNAYPDNVLTCWTNRIHKLSVGQQSECTSSDFEEVLRYADRIKEDRSTSVIKGPVSGFLLVIPKKIWKNTPFPEVNNYRPGDPNLLGVDNYFTNKIREKGIEILRMNGLIVYHGYRLLTGKKDHLL